MQGLACHTCESVRNKLVIFVAAFCGSGAEGQRIPVCV